MLGDGDEVADAFRGEAGAVGADYGVEAGDGGGDVGCGVDGSLLDGEVGLRGYLLGVAGDGGDFVATGEEFGEDDLAGFSGGSVEGYVHVGLPWCWGVDAGGVGFGSFVIRPKSPDSLSGLLVQFL